MRNQIWWEMFINDNFHQKRKLSSMVQWWLNYIALAEYIIQPNVSVQCDIVIEMSQFHSSFSRELCLFFVYCFSIRTMSIVVFWTLPNKIMNRFVRKNFNVIEQVLMRCERTVTSGHTTKNVIGSDFPDVKIPKLTLPEFLEPYFHKFEKFTAIVSTCFHHSTKYLRTNNNIDRRNAEINNKFHFLYKFELFRKTMIVYRIW